MIKQIILAGALILSFNGVANAKETSNSSVVTTQSESSTEAKSIEIRINITRGNYCLVEGSSCVISIYIIINSTNQLTAQIDQFDSTYDGLTIDGFTFEAIENNEYRTFIVPTQTLQWTGAGFLLDYE